MRVSVNFSDFHPPENTFVFSASALDLYRESNYKKYHKRIFEAIKAGIINPVVTPLELAKLRRESGDKYYEIYCPVWESKNSTVFCVEEINLNLQNYRQLCKLYMNRGIHLGDFSCAIVAIEFMLPLITDDDHHWILQKNFDKTYRKRHAETIAQRLIKKEKTKFFEMYRSKEFCEMFL